MEPDQIIARAEALAAIAENPHFRAIIAETRQAYVDGIIRADARDFEAMCELKARLDVVAEVEKRITGAINNGHMEARKRGLRGLFGGV